jgi:aldose 1-epimerase
MNIRRTTIGVTRGHAGQPSKPVDEYRLESRSGLAVTVWTYGASLIEVVTPDRNGRKDNVVLRLPELTSYEDRTTNPYIGAIMGRYARCIAEGRFTLDGNIYQLDRNFGRHHFHGGTIGFDRYVWDADAEKDDDRSSVTMRLERPDGDQGYPGQVSAEVTYKVGDEWLSIEFSATATASTIVALTNHAFWNLAAGGPIDNHWLTLNSHRRIVVDDELIPHGPPLPITGERLNFSKPRKIGDTVLDDCFVLDDPTWAAELFDPAGGRVMRVTTDQPGLAIYSAEGLVKPRSGLCLQTGAWPNSPNCPGYPSSRLDPGETYHHVVKYEFATR